MQFYLNGYAAGDPQVLPAAPSAMGASERLADEVDVLIVGCGPAGLVLAAQLAAFPDIKTRIVERRPGPLELGQADGVACRTVEMFNAFGFAERLLKEAYWVNETVFWRPDPENRTNIVRSGRIQDVEDGLSEFPHVIVNQARVHEYLLEVMRESSTRLVPHYNLHVKHVEVGDSGDYPVKVTLQRMDSDRPWARGDCPGPLRRRLRWLEEQRPAIDRPHVGGRLGQSGVGCDGCPGGHRLPGHPPQVGDSRRRGERPHHPPRGGIPGPLLHRARQARARSAPDDEGHHHGPFDRGR